MSPSGDPPGRSRQQQQQHGLKLKRTLLSWESKGNPSPGNKALVKIINHHDRAFLPGGGFGGGYP